MKDETELERVVGPPAGITVSACPATTGKSANSPVRRRAGGERANAMIRFGELLTSRVWPVVKRRQTTTSRQPTGIVLRQETTRRLRSPKSACIRKEVSRIYPGHAGRPGSILDSRRHSPQATLALSGVRASL